MIIKRERMKEHYSELSFTKLYWMPVMIMKLESKESIHVREEAVRWFSKSVGVTATWFIDICDLAGLNSQQVRAFARKLISDPDNTDFQRKRLNVLLNMTHKEETLTDNIIKQNEINVD